VPPSAALAPPRDEPPPADVAEALPTFDLTLEFLEPAESRPAGTAAVAVAERVAAVHAAPPAPAPQVAGPPDPRLETAGSLMAKGEFAQALEVLDALYVERPNDDALRRLTAEAEAAFTEKAYRHLVPASKVPALVRPLEDFDSEALTPRECFLLSRIDGTWDIKSIIQVAPFREVDALRTLARLRELGMIRLKDPS
jgi:hypothetical protein